MANPLDDKRGPRGWQFAVLGLIAVSVGVKLSGWSWLFDGAITASRAMIGCLLYYVAYRVATYTRTHNLAKGECRARELVMLAGYAAIIAMAFRM